MTTSYASNLEVAQFLQINMPTGFSSSTKPTDSIVDTLINRAEDYIDRRTGHAWRTVTVGNSTNGEYEYHSIMYRYRWDAGIPVYLNHRKIRQFTNGTDQLQVWDGSNWTDWISTKQEGRNKDFWVDYELGVVYFKTFFFTLRHRAVRIVYRYGDYSVPNDIKWVTILLTASMLAESDDRSILFPEGTSNISLSEKVQKWKDQAEEILKMYVEPKVVGEMVVQPRYGV